MKLIDADKLKRTEGMFQYQINDAFDRLSASAYRFEDVENAPTVEAIPVEWIKKWDAKCQNGELSYWLCDDYEWHEAIVAMLADWKEENETD